MSSTTEKEQELKPLRESGDDPRRPATLKKPFYIPPLEEEAGYSQAAITASLFLGLMGLLLKTRLLAWASVMTVVAGLANMPRANLDLKQIISSVMIAVMGLVMSYIMPSFNPQQ